MKVTFFKMVSDPIQSDPWMDPDNGNWATPVRHPSKTSAISHIQQ